MKKELRREEDEHAERRLRRYFFNEEQWKALPERARRSLVEADRVWNASRFGRIESILNELRIATEEVMNVLFWKPLCEWMEKTKLSDVQLLDFQRIREELERERKQPALVHLEKMLRTRSFQGFCSNSGAFRSELDFLTKELPKALGNLRKPRTIGEHSLGSVATREYVASFYRQYLGLNCKGILPRLANLKLKLEAKERN